MLQNFALFADRSVTVKILNCMYSTRAVAIVCAKIDHKVSSKGLTRNYAKFGTSKNFPLYGILHQGLIEPL